MRHPKPVALELSSFKCGYDAPIYGAIEGIIEQSGTLYFSFKDLDENKPSGRSVLAWKASIIFFAAATTLWSADGNRETENDVAMFERSLREKERDQYELAAAGD